MVPLKIPIFKIFAISCLMLLISVTGLSANGNVAVQFRARASFSTPAYGYTQNQLLISGHRTQLNQLNTYDLGYVPTNTFANIRYRSAGYYSAQALVLPQTSCGYTQPYRQPYVQPQYQSSCQPAYTEPYYQTAAPPPRVVVQPELAPQPQVEPPCPSCPQTAYQTAPAPYVAPQVGYYRQEYRQNYVQPAPVLIQRNVARDYYHRQSAQILVQRQVARQYYAPALIQRNVVRERVAIRAKVVVPQPLVVRQTRREVITTRSVQRSTTSVSAGFFSQRSVSRSRF